MTVRCGTTVVIALAAGCAQAPATVQSGEALLVVDTDAPVPALVARLRVDLYTIDGTWYATRDAALPDVSQWPTSFAVALDDSDTTRDLVVRLRAYPEGATRDYAGEQFQPRATVCDVPSCLGSSPGPCCPAQLAPVAAPVSEQLSDPSNQDVTPPTEPQPLVAIDRLVQIHLDAGVRGSVSVVLAGACFGTMSDLRDFTQLSTCVDTENTRVPVAVASLDPSLTVPTASVAGQLGQSYGADCTQPPRAGGQAADGAPLHDEEVCVRGGAFALGGRDGYVGQPTDSLPARAALVPSFRMDRQEVTVARFRAARQAGFTGSAIVNDGPIGGFDVDAFDSTMCTFSTAPIGREDYPVSCVSPAVARAFCRSLGGDLPTEVQWEYAATMSGRPRKTHFAAGDDSPACTAAVYGRGNSNYNVDCDADGTARNVPVGPASVTWADRPDGDVTPGLAIANLTGNVAEWTLDTFASLSSNCWMAAGLVLPSCTAVNVRQAATSLRGSSWVEGGPSLVAEWRDYNAAATPVEGFRCVRPGGS